MLSESENVLFQFTANGLGSGGNDRVFVFTAGYYVMLEYWSLALVLS